MEAAKAILQDQIQRTQETWSHEYAQPEDHVAQNVSTFEKPCPTQHDQRQLRHLHHQQVTPHLLEDDCHDQFMDTGREQEGH